MSTTAADTRTTAGGDEDWRGRLVPAEQAVAAIPPGSNVYVGSACGTPRTVVRLLEGVPYEHRGTRLVHFLTDGLAVDGASLEHRTLFLGRTLPGGVRLRHHARPVARHAEERHHRGQRDHGDEDHADPEEDGDRPAVAHQLHTAPADRDRVEREHHQQDDGGCLLAH